ncbi:MAG: serine/threonine protein kinase [Deltaproteobacteria bacterium]|nr:serine/threonine protein kinase [Deltaproteobacteria bacterium]
MKRLSAALAAPTTRPWTTMLARSPGTKARPATGPSGPRALCRDGPRFPPGRWLAGAGYVVVRHLASGGMAEVYEARDLRRGRWCALKVLHARLVQRADFARRMQAEARALAASCHPNLVRFERAGTLGDGRPFIATELLVGRTLREELRRRGPVPLARALRWTGELLSGLEAVHRAGWVHCDVKLENAFLCEDGAIKLLDLGAAQSQKPAESRARSAIGTPRYMAPELCACLPVDGRTDVYAAGLLLCELVCGTSPLHDLGGDTERLLRAQWERYPPWPDEQYARRLPCALRPVVLRAVAKPPAARFASAADMARALREVSA